MKHLTRLAPIALPMALLLAATHAHAQVKVSDSLSISGFGTVGVSAADTREAYFSQPYRLDKVDRSGDAGLDSKLALQANQKLAPSVVLVLQVIAQQTAQDNFKPSPEWAFARWDVDERLSLRIGRIGAPFFMNSDSRGINYTQLTARPSFDVYGQVPVSHFDGADVVYRFDVGGASVSASAWGGRSTAKVIDVSEQELGANLAEVTLDRLFGLNFSLMLDNGLTLRAGAARADVTLGAGSTGAVPGLASEAAADILRATTTRREPIMFTGFGAAYERGPWWLSAEYTWLRSDTQIADTTGWYLNAGYRIRSVTPFIGISRIRVDDINRPNPLAGAVGQPGDVGAWADKIQRYLDGSQVSQRTLTLGARWDVVDKVALKVQWDRVFKPPQSFGAFRPRHAADVPDFYDHRRQIDVLSLNVDFVF